MSSNSGGWAMICHVDDGEQGTVSILTESDGEFDVQCLAASTHSGKPADRSPYFLGVNSENQIVMLDRESKLISAQEQIPADAFPAYVYRDPDSNYVWFMTDGDKKTGNDTLNCGEQGSSVTVINGNAAGTPELIKTICVGRGHHVTTFTAPTEKMPNIPKRAFVSNLIDGSITVVGNDSSDNETYLKVMDTINLGESEKEDGGDISTPNNAFPHGKEFSAFTGKIYSLNNGYATVAVIDPVSNEIESRIGLKVSSNLLLSPDGRFLIGKGADRKSNPEHVMGRLTVIDAVQQEVISTHDLQDVYPSAYRFSPDGSKLYVTTASTGKGVQHDNLKMSVLQIYDTSALPAFSLLKEVEVGVADCGRRPIAFASDDGELKRVFIPNPTDGTVTVLDGDDNVLDTVKVSEGNAKDVNFSFWRGDTHGA